MNQQVFKSTQSSSLTIALIIASVTIGTAPLLPPVVIAASLGDYCHQPFPTEHAHQKGEHTIAASARAASSSAGSLMLMLMELRSLSRVNASSEGKSENPSSKLSEPLAAEAAGLGRHVKRLHISHRRSHLFCRHLASRKTYMTFNAPDKGQTKRDTVVTTGQRRLMSKSYRTA